MNHNDESLPSPVAQKFAPLTQMAVLKAIANGTAIPLGDNAKNAGLVPKAALSDQGYTKNVAGVARVNVVNGVATGNATVRPVTGGNTSNNVTTQAFVTNMLQMDTAINEAESEGEE